MLHKLYRLQLPKMKWVELNYQQISTIQVKFQVIKANNYSIDNNFLSNFFSCLSNLDLLQDSYGSFLSFKVKYKIPCMACVFPPRHRVIRKGLSGGIIISPFGLPIYPPFKPKSLGWEGGRRYSRAGSISSPHVLILERGQLRPYLLQWRDSPTTSRGLFVIQGRGENDACPVLIG